MGLSSSKTTNTTSNEPPSWAKPYVERGLQQTQDVFDQNQPVLQQMSNMAMDAYKDVAPLALRTSQYADTALNAAQTIGGGKFIGQGPGSTTYSDIQNSQNPAVSGLSLLGQTGGTASPSASFYADVLGGKYLGSNPYLDGIVQQGTDAATKAVNQRMAATGMGGGMSSPYIDLLSKNVQNASNQLRYSDYNSQLDRMTQVGGQADAANNAANQIRLGATTALGSQFNDQQQTRLGAAAQADATQNAERSQQLAALGLVPDLSNAQYAGVAPALSLLSESASIPYVGTQAFNGGVSGLTSNYGTSTGTQTSSGNLMQSLMGLGGSLGSAYLGRK